MICTEFEHKYEREYGKSIKLAHNTLLNLAKGGKTLSQFNVEKRRLIEGEEDQLITCTLDYALCEFPMNLWQFKEHADEILHNWLGHKFPKKGVGENWAYQFVKKNSNHLSIC